MLKEKVRLENVSILGETKKNFLLYLSYNVFLLQSIM